MISRRRNRFASKTAEPIKAIGFPIALADEPVQGEPVSGEDSLLSEKNREFRENRAVWQKAARQNVAKSAR